MRIVKEFQVIGFYSCNRIVEKKYYYQFIYLIVWIYKGFKEFLNIIFIKLK